METLGTQYAEAMISSLNYTLGRTSSAIHDRRHVKINPTGPTKYSPEKTNTKETKHDKLIKSEKNRRGKKKHCTKVLIIVEQQLHEGAYHSRNKTRVVVRSGAASGGPSAFKILLDQTD